MHASLFSLVTTEDPTIVFAWGMEIVDYVNGEERTKTILHIGPPNSSGTISTRVSAEKACARWSTIVPLDIVWDAEPWIEATRLAAGGTRALSVTAVTQNSR
jgi:hypothetical protein